MTWIFLSCSVIMQTSIPKISSFHRSTQGKVYQVQDVGTKRKPMMYLAAMFVYCSCLSMPFWVWHYTRGCNDLVYPQHWKWYQTIHSSTKLHRYSVMTRTLLTQQDTVKAGEEALLCLYNGSAKDDLDSLRYKRYSEKVKTSSKAVKAHNLPPSYLSCSTTNKPLNCLTNEPN